MKKFFCCFAFTLMLLFVSSTAASGNGFDSVITRNEDSAQVSIGEARWQLASTGEREAQELRIYGFNPNGFRTSQPDSFTTLASFVFVAGDRALANESYNKDGCEKAAFNYVRFLHVIPADKPLYNEVNALSVQHKADDGRMCIRVEFTPYRITGYSLKGADKSEEINQEVAINEELVQSGKASHPINQILLHSIFQIPCQ